MKSVDQSAWTGNDIPVTTKFLLNLDFVFFWCSALAFEVLLAIMA